METSNVKIPLIKKQSSYKIIIPANVERQIRFLCARVWDTEWSGVLFYTPSGNFEDGSLEVRCVDILPMDVGSSTYTEFNMSPDVISYMAQNPELLDCKTGLIHSHNNMATFFSGTDINTLLDEGKDKNHFVSLIVNNAGKYTAAITRKIKYHSIRSLSYEGFNGEVNLDDKDEFDGEEIEYFNLDIVFEEEQDSKFKEIADRITEIKKSKAASPTYSSYNSGSSYTPSYSGLPKTTTNIYTAPHREPTLFDDVDWKGGYKGYKEEVKEQPKEKEKPKDINPFKGTPILEDASISAADIEKILNQLITGCVTVTKLDTDTKKKLINSIVTRFDNRFGKDDEGLFLFNQWATNFIEFLIWYSVPGDDTGELVEDVCIKLIEALHELPVNRYINEYIEILNTYVGRF